MDQRFTRISLKLKNHETHADESARVCHKAGVFFEPLIQIFPPGSVVPSKPGAVVEIDDWDPALGVCGDLTGVLAVARHRCCSHAHLANTPPPRRYLEVHEYQMPFIYYK